MKQSVIISIVCFLLCICFAIGMIISSINIIYAEEHYFYTREAVRKHPTLYIYNYYYGCGEIDCMYCHGVHRRPDTYNDIGYYKINKTLNLYSLIGTIAFGSITLISLCACAFICCRNSNKKDCCKEISS
jgi:hypothetical protein